MCSAQDGTWRRARTCLNPEVIWRLQMQHQSRSFRSKARARIFNKKEQHQQESVSKRSKSSDLRGRSTGFPEPIILRFCLAQDEREAQIIWLYGCELDA